MAEGPGPRLYSCAASRLFEVRRLELSGREKCYAEA